MAKAPVFAQVIRAGRCGGSAGRVGRLSVIGGLMKSSTTRFLTASLAIALAGALLDGCSVGPNYKRPTIDVGTAYKELTDWKPAEPKDELIRGKWWQVFADADLNELAAQ